MSPTLALPAANLALGIAGKVANGIADALDPAKAKLKKQADDFETMFLEQMTDRLTASEGTDAAHKLNRDQPDLVFIDASLRGVMNALELCMYARGIEALARAELVLIGEVGDRDHGLLSAAHVTFLADDANLGEAFLDRVRAGVKQRRRTTTTRRTVSG